MIKLFHADALTFDYSQFKFDAIVSDPPYNINYNTNHGRRYGSFKTIKSINPHLIKGRKNKVYEPIENENEIDYSFLFDLGIKKMCLFGLNNYVEYVPLDIYYGGSYSIWDKRSDGMIQKVSDNMIGGGFEIIWFYPKRKIDFIRYLYCGFFGSQREPEGKRVHPTQKPTEVMKWCIEKLKLPENATVIDPFMGSGSTGRACQELELNFIGIEKSKTYFDIAHRRLLGGFQDDIFN